MRTSVFILYACMCLVPLSIVAQECQTTPAGMYTVEVCQSGPDDKPWPEFHDTSTKASGYQLWLARAPGLTAYLGLTKDRPNLLQIALGYFGDAPQKTFDVTIHNAQRFSEPDPLVWRMGEKTGEALRTEKGIKVLGVTMAKGQTAGLTITGKPKPPPPEPDWKIVYTCQPRATDPVPPLLMDGTAPWQRIPDMARVWRTSETNLCIGDLAGNEKVIHDCTGTDAWCAAADGRVSWDGTKIYYSVSYPRLDAQLNRGLWKVTTFGGIQTEMMEFDTHEAQLWEYDLASGQSRAVTGGHRDKMPAPAWDNLVYFMCDRGNVFPPKSLDGTTYNDNYRTATMQLCSGRMVDGRMTDIRIEAPHDINAQSPTVLSTGWVAYSAWEGMAPRDCGSTSMNCAWIVTNDHRVLLGAHSHLIPNFAMREKLGDWLDPNRGGVGTVGMLALRSVEEVFPGVLCANNYYAKNKHGGVASILCWPMQTDQREGASKAKDVQALPAWQRQSPAAQLPGSGHYIPSEMYVAAPFGTVSDVGAIGRYHKDGRLAGSAGFPAPLPDDWSAEGDADDWLATVSRGACFEDLPPAKANLEHTGGEPLCHKQGRIVFQPVLENPFDEKQSRCIARCGEKDGHAWNLQWIDTYEKVHGHPAPTAPRIETTGECRLNVVNALARELDPVPGMTSRTQRTTWQGDADYAPGPDAFFAAQEVEQHHQAPTAPGFAGMGPNHKAPLEADGSVSLVVPCETPLQHLGVNAAGEMTSIGRKLDSLGPGETRTCHGCHDGHSEERAAQLPPAEERFKHTIAGRKLP